MKKAEQQMREAERAMREAAERNWRRFQSGTTSGSRKIDRRVVLFGERARLGLVLQSEKNPKTDAIGAYVEALTPGSPAEEAGLQPGDIIVKFNGEPLASAKVEADEDESVPTARLMELARRPQGRRQGHAGVPTRETRHAPSRSPPPGPWDPASGWSPCPSSP